MSDMHGERSVVAPGAARLIAPRLVPRIWGGNRLPALLGAASSDAIGEAWFGVADGRSSAPLAKLLDVRDRLSVQVHPDDALARELHGVGEIGKHEAWVIVEADPGATILLGRDRSVSTAQLAAALDAGEPVEPLLARVPVTPGDVIDVPPGLLHALMPNLLVWELQQPSDRTYRVSDWGRDDASRPLHRSEALRATDASAVAGESVRVPAAPGPHRLLASGALRITAIVGPWSGCLATSRGDVATLIALRATAIAPSGGERDALSVAKIGGCALPHFASARLGGGETELSLPTGETLLIGGLSAE